MYININQLERSASPNSMVLTNASGEPEYVVYTPPSGGLTQEQVEDIMSTFLVPGANVTLVYDDVTNTLTVSATSTPGPQGPQGIQGPIGPTGATGSQGPVGATGADGAQGIQGVSGVAGPQGPAGTNGTNGQGVPTGGTANQVLSKVDGTDFNTQWVTPSSGGSLINGVYEITGVLNQLEYTIPYTATMVSAHVNEIKNSAGSGYFGAYIIEIVSGTGIKVIYNVQPPVGQLIKFNYIII